MKIIEITGVAGVGKSYILKALLKDKYVVSDVDILRRYSVSDIYLIYLFFRLKGSIKIFKTILNIARELNMSLLDKLNFIRNTVKKVGKNVYLSNIEFIDNRVVLVDEGISHLYQNVVTPKRQNNLKILILLNKFISMVEKQFPAEVIVVKASVPTIMERLKQRGHKRLKKGEIELFIKNSEKNLSVVYKVFNNVRTITNEDDLELIQGVTNV
jgi:dephospho-CoA kinase